VTSARDRDSVPVVYPAIYRPNYRKLASRSPPSSDRSAKLSRRAHQWRGRDDCDSIDFSSLESSPLIFRRDEKEANPTRQSAMADQRQCLFPCSGKFEILKSASKRKEIGREFSGSESDPHAAAKFKIAARGGGSGREQDLCIVLTRERALLASS